MGKGVLLEMAGRQAVVLTPQGEFKKIPAPRGTWEIGDEVEFAEPRGTSLWARWGATAAAAAVLMIGSFVGYNQYTLTVPVAVVTVDINPSLELTLNKKDQVLRVEALNADGELVLQGVAWDRKPFDQVVRAVTERAVEEHKLNPADETSAVLVGVAPANEKALPAAQAERVVERAKAAVTAEVAQAAHELGQESKTSVAVLVATADEKKEADREGLSIGKYKLLPEIQSVAPQVTPEEIKEFGPGRLLKDLHIDTSEIFKEAEKKNERSRPAAGNPADDKDDKKEDKGQGGSKDPMKENPPTVGAGQDDKPGSDKKAETDKKSDADKKAEPDKKPESADKGEPGRPAEPDKKGNSGNKGQSDAKSEPDRKQEADRKNGSDKKDQPKKDDVNKGQEKKNSWTIPFLGITIEKPAFLSDKDEPQPAEVVETSTPDTPRANQPGAGASEEPKADDSHGKDPRGGENQGNGSQGNDSQGNGSQGNGSKGNGSQEKNSDGNDAKGKPAQEESKEQESKVKESKENRGKQEPSGKGEEKKSEKEIPRSRGKESKD